jgi:hypothetical protein
MKHGNIQAGILAFFAVVLACSVPVLADDSAKQTQDVPKTPGRSFIVYYFYTNVRCPTCHKLENYTEEAVTGYFADLIKQGVIQYKGVNTDEKGNEHFLKDYELYTKSVIVSEIQDGQQKRWKNLDKIWERVGDKEKYLKYIQDEVKAYIENP